MVLKLYVDRTLNACVGGKRNATAVVLPPFYKGSKITLNVYVLEPTGSFSTPYTVASITGKSCRVALGNPVGSVVAASATTFTISTDGDGDKYFSGLFDCSQAGFTTFVGSTYIETAAWLEVQLSDDGSAWDKLVQVDARCRQTLVT